MKVLILVSSLLAAASAVYLGPQHIPVLDSRGVPVEPLENQAARSAHYAALAEASARTGTYSPIAYSAPYVTSVPAVAGIPANALPADTPEVAAARIQHFQDYAIAAQRNGVNVVAPVAAVSGYPLDTPEVQLAKAAHFAAHAAARAGVHLRKRRDLYAYPVINNGVPVNTPEVQRATAEHLAAHASITGVPLDTPEVAAAKANHFAAHAAALTRSGPFVAAVAPYYYGSVYPHAAIGPDGHPVETPEVQLAKAAHYAAHLDAARRG